ncbi:MAG: hypothetical protein MRJ93_04765 [Nitrososphaeraceae archaeon]|nr:hypothetical protein [Nitrososphaeraceae archaeon]
MNDILNIFPVDTNKKETEKDRHKDIRFTVRISPEEYAYFSNVISILYNIKVNGRPLLKSMSLPSVCKMALQWFCNNCSNGFANNDIVNNIDIDDMETFEKFLAFRVKYMDYPLENQIEDLKKDRYLK